MKKRRLIVLAAAVVLMLTGIAAGWWLTHPALKDVFRRLDMSQVEFIGVYRSHFSPALEPETVLSESDAERVVDLLRQVRLSGEPTQDYANLQGMRVQPWFHVKLKNGTEFDFRACPPFFLVNTGNLGYVPHQRRENTIMGYQSPSERDDEDYALSEKIGALHTVLTAKYFE